MSHGLPRFFLHGVRIGRLPLRLGTERGVEVRAHWLLLMVPVAELLSRLLAPAAPYGAPLLSWAVSVAALGASLITHEVGHLLALKWAGGATRRVLLWPLGGLEPGELPEEPRLHLRVAAAGPAFTALLLAGAIAACVGSGFALLPPAEAPAAFPALQALAQYLVLWNAFLLILNLLPCAPLDGERLLEAAIWSRCESRFQARFLARKVGLATAIGAGTAAALLFLSSFFLGPEYAVRHPFLMALSWGLILVAVMYYLESRIEDLREAEREEGDGVFGYDFSSGYTSLERAATRRPRRRSLLGRWRESRRRRGQARQVEEDQRMKRRLDALLEKIHAQGLDSLTPEERRFLERASRQLRG